MKVEVKGTKIFLETPYSMKDTVKSIPGRRWHPEKKQWSVPYDEETVPIVNALFNTKIDVPVIDRVEDIQPVDDPIINKLYEHQRRSVYMARNTPYFADLSEPGSGKTLVQIEMLLERDHWPALIICPKSIMEAVWQNQLNEMKKETNSHLTPVILNNGSVKVKQNLRSIKDGVVKVKMAFPTDDYTLWVGMCCIINYDMVPLVIDDLLQIPWQVVILDESTKIKSPSAKRSKAIMRLRDKAKFRSIMTGTLAPNGLQDAFNQFKFLQPMIFGESFYAFRGRYFTQGGYMNYEWSPMPNALPRFRSKIAGISIQHHKRDCVDLPPIVESPRLVTMTKPQEDAYKQMKEQALIAINEATTITAQFVITQLMKLRQIASGFIYNESETIKIDKTNPKVNELREILEELGNDKCIVFCHFNHTIDYLSENLAGSVAFRGNDQRKSEALKRFETDDKCTILIANPASAGHGLNLQFCSNIIYFELDFNLENYLQSMDRINRIGQKNKMTIYYLIAKNTVDNYILKRLKNKQDINRELDINELKEQI